MLPTHVSGFQGKVLGLPFDSSPQFSELVAPLVLCETDVMTFMASGEIFAYMLVDRGKTFELSDEVLLNC